MKFSNRATVRRLGPSRYQLSYGQGEKRLIDVAEGGRGGWRIIGRDDLGEAPTIGQIKNRWAEWAAGIYTLNITPPPPPVRCPPSLSPRRNVARICDPASYGVLEQGDSVTNEEKDALLQPIGDDV